jgi:hypothetical protein
MGIIKEIQEEIRAVDVEPTSRDLWILAVVFLVVLSAIGAYSLFISGKWTGKIWMGAGVVLFFCRFIPPLFRLIYKFWIRLAIVLGYFVSRILLTIVFFLVVTPTGLIRRLMGKDPMKKKLDPKAGGYWEPKTDQGEQTIERYEKQF